MAFSLPSYNLNLDELNSACRDFEKGIQRFGSVDDNQTFLIDAEREKLASLLIDSELLTRDLEELPSLGMIGKLASGKTSCVELLLGSVGALGACQQTGTINAVEYNVACVETDVSTSFENWRCEFMSEEELLKLVPSYRNKIKMELEQACANGKNRLVREFALQVSNLDGTPNSNYVDEIFKFRQEKQYWKELYQWTVALYGKLPSSEVPVLCKSLIELYLYAESAYFGREWFGKKCRISSEQGKRLSVLESVKSVTPVQASGTEFPRVPRATNEGDAYIDITALPECDKLRYLVKIIRVDVKAPKKTTERFTVGGRLRLIDVPGLGSDRSSIRDKALMGATLPELNGILFIFDVVNRADLGAGVEMLSAAGALDRTVFVCSKFDLLEFPRNANGTAEFDAKLDLNGEVRFQNWENFNDLLACFEGNFNYNYDRFAPFSSFYFLGCDTRELENFDKGTSDGESQDLFSDYASDDFLNDRYGKFRKSQSERVTLAKGLANMVQNLRDNHKPSQRPIVDMLESFHKDGGVGRLVDAYGQLLRTSAAQNRLNALNDRLEKLYNAYNEIEKRVEERRAASRASEGNVTPQSAGIFTRKIRNWSENVWESLKPKIDEVLANNAQVAKRTFLASLSTLRMWDELYESQWTWKANDYMLSLGGDNNPSEYGRSLCNDEDSKLPQDTEELFGNIMRMYAQFVDVVCNNLTRVSENSRYRSLGDVFDDWQRSFRIDDSEMKELQNFCSLVRSCGDKFLIDKFGIVENNWLDRHSCNFYSVLSKYFLGECDKKIQEKSRDWKERKRLEEAYPLQLRRNNEDGESRAQKREFPWCKKFKKEFAAYLDANPAISKTKLSSERIRELKYQLLKSCDYLVDNLYNTLRLNLYAIVDNMKKDLDKQIGNWERRVLLDSSGTGVEQGYDEDQVPSE